MKGDGSLRGAWYGFCESLRDAWEDISGDDVPDDPGTRTSGVQYLHRLAGLALDLFVEHADPMHPELFTFFGTTRKQAGDNPDAVYLGAHIDGRERYRLVGTRGSARYFLLTVAKPTEARGGGHAGDLLYGTADAFLLGTDLVTEADGSFEVHLGPEVDGPNTIRTSPEVSWLNIRQFFGDWHLEEPMTARLEHVGGDDALAPPPLQPDVLVERLQAAGEFVGSSLRYWKGRRVRHLADPAHSVNTFSPTSPVNVTNPKLQGQSGGMAAGGSGLECYWSLDTDQALLIRFQPVMAAFWNLELNDFWLCSMDYRHRLSSLNCAQAVREPDGSVVVVLSHGDPGIANWLDAYGQRHGRIGTRWMLAPTLPAIETELVALDDLDSALPHDVQRITPAQRAEQLRLRSLGVDRRFRHYAGPA